MSNTYSFPDLQTPVPEEQRADIAVVGGDVASVVTAFMLSKRGHRVFWYRGQDCNPHPSSGALKTYACEPMALPGYLLCLPQLLGRNAIRGKLHGELSWAFLGWVLRAVADSRPLFAEAIAQDRSALLSGVVPAFTELGKVITVDFDQTQISTLYPSARSYAMGWAVHDVRRRHGADFQELSFENIAKRYPHVSPQYTHGVSIPDIPVIANAEDLVEKLKEYLSEHAKIVRHWPQCVKIKGKDRVEIKDGDTTRSFDWVVRGDYSGPSQMWPEHIGGTPLSLCYRERHLRRDMPADAAIEYDMNHVLVDGTSSAWMEHQDANLIAAGAHSLGGNVTEDLKYLVGASYAKIWRTLAGEGWQSEGGRVTVSCGCLTPDSKPLLGVASSRILEAAGLADLGWTLSTTAGFAMIAHVEGDHAGCAHYQAFSPKRFA